MRGKMSKKTDNYAALASSLGMRFDSTNNVVYGQKDGFDLILYVEDKNYPYMFTAHTAAKSPDGSMLSKDDLKSLTKSAKPIGTCSQDGNNITMVIAGQTNQEKCRNSVAEALNGLISFLRARGYTPCCSICGKSVEVTAHKSGGNYLHLCAECETNLRGNLAVVAQQKQQKKENVVGGVIGALLGSLVGVLCIILLSQLGYVAALSGAVMAVGVLKGYEMLGGKLTKKGIVISVVIMLVMTYIGDRLDWAIRLVGEGGGADAGFTFFECYRMVPWMMREGVIETTAYVANLVLLYVFLLLGAVPTIRSKVKEKKEAGEMIRIGSSGGMIQ